MKKHSLKIIALGLSTCLTLAACQTVPESGPNLNGSMTHAAKEKKAPRSVSFLEGAYSRNSGDVAIATEYAESLRLAGDLNKAALVLAPFANDKGSPADTKAEYAAIQLAMGNNPGAEQFAQKAVLQDPENYLAYHYLGIALDSQSKHEEAERAFRKGLEYWVGDPVPIMNNLALNLTAQGYLDEASELLQKAQALDPDRIELERNLRIVRALQQSQGRLVPKPAAKPEMKTEFKTKPKLEVESKPEVKTEAKPAPAKKEEKKEEKAAEKKSDQKPAPAKAEKAEPPAAAPKVNN